MCTFIEDKPTGRFRSASTGLQALACMVSSAFDAVAYRGVLTALVCSATAASIACSDTTKERIPQVR